MGLPVSSYSSTRCLPEDDTAQAAALLRFFPTSSGGYVLLLDDTDFHFSSGLARHFDSSKIISTTCLSESTLFDSSLENVKILWGLHHPDQTIISKAAQDLIPWDDIKCVLWFPHLDSSSENMDRHRNILQNFFEYLAVRILADALFEVQVIITMNNIRFSLLEVTQLIVVVISALVNLNNSLHPITSIACSFFGTNLHLICRALLFKTSGGKIG